jgi:uncharacterized membrane protein YdbT with pleckstrin-like domain
MRKRVIYRQSVWVLIFRLLVLEFVVIAIGSGLSAAGIMLADNAYIYGPSTWLYWSIRIVELFSLVWITLVWASVRYSISDQQIITESGVFFDSEKVYLIDNIESVKLNRGFLGMLCNYGTIRLYAPTLKEQIFLRNIPQSRQLSKLLTKYISRHHKDVRVIAQD